MQRKMNKLGCNLEIIVVDSKAHNTIKEVQLQGGMINLTTRKVPAIIKKIRLKQMNQVDRQCTYSQIERKEY